MLLVEARRPGTFKAIYAFEPTVPPPGIAEESERRERFLDPENESRVSQMSPKHPTWGRLPEIQCPVLIASGRCIPMTPSSFAQRIGQRLPDSRLEVYEGLGHMRPFEAPCRIGSGVKAFFEGVDSTARVASAESCWRDEMI